MLKGRTLIRAGIGSFLLAIVLGALCLKYFPADSLGYNVGGFVSLILLLTFLPLIMWGFLKRQQERPSSIFKNRAYFWGAIIGLLSLGVTFLIITILMILLSVYAPFFFIPLYFSAIYLVFAVILLRYRKSKLNE